MLFCDASGVLVGATGLQMWFCFFPKGKVTRPDLVPQLITASQTLQITGDSELSVDSHWKQMWGRFTSTDTQEKEMPLKPSIKVLSWVYEFTRAHCEEACVYSGTGRFLFQHF